MSKQNLAVIFGGQSSEHEISCMSASNIIQCIDAQRYNIILVGITKEGHWVEAADLNAVQDGSWRQSKTSIVLSPDATRKGLYRMSEDEKVQFVYTERTELFRAYLSLQVFRLLDVVYLHQLLVWISFTQRL